MLRLWKGFHDQELPRLIEESGSSDPLLVLCPPFLEDYRFLRVLPRSRLSLHGSGWTADEHAAVYEAANLPRIPVEYPEKPVLGVFTSGTVTGTPRLVLYSRSCLEASLSAIREVMGHGIDAIFCYPQPFHTFGLVLGYVQSVLHRLPLHVPQGRYSMEAHARWLEAAREHPGLLTLGTPTHFRDLLQWAAERDLPATRTAILGGAPVAPELWRALRDELGISAPSIGYGCTEASPGLTHQAPGVEPREFGEVGRPLRGVELSMIPGSGLRFDGPQTCLAIVQGEEVVFPKHVLIRDRLDQREDGTWVFRGRLDLVINRGGLKFSLEQIEGHLREVFQAEAGVDFLAVAVPDERLGEELGLVVASRGQDETALRERVSQALVERFHAHFAEENFVLTERVPVNASAKPDRKQALEKIRSLRAGVEL